MCSQARSRTTSNCSRSFPIARCKSLWLLQGSHVHATSSYNRQTWGRQQKRLRGLPWKRDTWRRAGGVYQSRVSLVLWRDCTEHGISRKRCANSGWYALSCSMRALFTATSGLFRHSCMVRPISQRSLSISSSSLCSRDPASSQSKVLLGRAPEVSWLTLHFQRRRVVALFGKACKLFVVRLPHYLFLAQQFPKSSSFSCASWFTSYSRSHPDQPPLQ